MTIVRIAVNSAQDQAIAGNPGSKKKPPPIWRGLIA